MVNFLFFWTKVGIYIPKLIVFGKLLAQIHPVRAITCSLSDFPPFVKAYRRLSVAVCFSRLN